MTTMKPRRDLDHVIQVYNRQGCYPVPWRHHPPEVCALIRALNFRPQMKGCYSNAQRFFVGNFHLGAQLELEYREGWIQNVIPIQHAWLLYKGEVLDLTLDSRATQYLDSQGFTVERVIANMIKTRHYCQVLSCAEYYRISPYREAMEEARKTHVG